jgi:hypothetical protein
MAATRKVTGTVRKPSGEPHSGVRVSFTLVPGSYTPDDQFPQGKVSVTTEADGTFEATLWTNEVGEIASVYVCKLPFGASFRFTLPAGSTPIELSVLRQAGVTPSDPQYDTLVTWTLAQWKNAWAIGTAYARGEKVSHEGSSYIATADTTAGQEPGVHASWDPLALQGDQGIQGIQGTQGIQGEQGTNVYDLAFFVAGSPVDDEIVGSFVAVRAVTLADDFAGSLAQAGTAATAETVFIVNVNGAPVGTVTFAAAGTVGTLVTTGGAVALVAGDVLSLVAPAVADATIADIAITLLGLAP